MTPERLEEIELLEKLGWNDMRIVPYRKAIQDLRTYARELKELLDRVSARNIEQAKRIRDGMPEVRDETLEEAAVICDKVDAVLADVCAKAIRKRKAGYTAGEANTRTIEEAAGVCENYAVSAEDMAAWPYPYDFAGEEVTPEIRKLFARDGSVARELARAIREHFAERKAARFATDANGTTHMATAIFTRSFNTKCGLKESLLMSFSVEGSTDNREVWCSKCFEEERKAAST